MSRDPRQLALDYLRHHQVVTLATHGPAGVWAAAVFYVNDGFDLFFLSAAHTRHAQNIAADPAVAATVQEDYEGWRTIQGIQMEGTVALLDGAEQDAAVALYLEKYPFLADAGERMEAALAQVRWYRLIPRRLYFIDNSQGLGHRDEIALEGQE